MGASSSSASGATYASSHTGLFGSFPTREKGGEKRMRTPVSLKQLRMSDELLEYLQATPLFCLPESELTKQGFSRCVDHPGVPGHLYYEGYFHALSTPSPVVSINPRKGHSMDKPACDRRLRAFVAAFKQLNHDWIEQAVSGNDDASQFFKTLVKKDWHFADVAVQVHAGDQIDEKNIGWHSDAPNSTLHLALSIRGKRALHSRLANKIDDADMQLVVHPQQAGDIYVSSPFAFPHGVEYSEAREWEDRIVAIQIRFLLTVEDYMNMREAYMSLASFMNWTTQALESHKVVVPTLDEVKAAEKSLQEADPYVYVPPVAKSADDNMYAPPPKQDSTSSTA